jgi:hypothetical protein
MGFSSVFRAAIFFFDGGLYSSSAICPPPTDLPLALGGTMILVGGDLLAGVSPIETKSEIIIDGKARIIA